MWQEVTLDISSPFHASQSYNTCSLRSIPILIFICNDTRELQTAGPLMAVLNTQMDWLTDVHKNKTYSNIQHKCLEKILEQMVGKKKKKDS